MTRKSAGQTDSNYRFLFCVMVKDACPGLHWKPSIQSQEHTNELESLLNQKIHYNILCPDNSLTTFYIGIPYPLKTPRTKLSMKNDPITISGMKNTQLKALPRASFVCKSYRSFRIYNLEMLTVDSPSTLLVSILPWSHIEKLSASPAQCCQKMWFLKYCQFYDHYTGCRGTNIHLYWARPTSPDILTHYAWYYDMQ